MDRNNAAPNWYQKILLELSAIRNAIYVLQMQHDNTNNRRQRSVHRSPRRVQSTTTSDQPAPAPVVTKRRQVLNEEVNRDVNNGPCWYHRNFGQATDPRNCNGRCGYIPPIVKPTMVKKPLVKNKPSTISKAPTQMPKPATNTELMEEDLLLSESEGEDKTNKDQ